MTVAVSVQWTSPPSKLAQAIIDFGPKVWDAVFAVAGYIAVEAQNEMRRDASWTDRTGLARANLRGHAERAAKDIVAIYLIHGMEYGIFLELANSGRYAIIGPEMQRIFPRIKKALDDIFR